MPLGRLLHWHRPILWAKDKVHSPPAIMQVITEDQNNCHVATPAAVTMPYASRHVAKCLAHTSPGREHNRLHWAHPTIRLASPSLNHALGAQMMVVDGMKHIPLQGHPLRTRRSCIYAKTQTNTSLIQKPGHIPWCRQIFGSSSPYPRRRAPYFPSSDLGLIN